MRVKSIICIAVVLAVLCPVVAVGGSVFGSMSTAQSYQQGRGVLGGAVGIAEANSVAGWFGYGMSKYIDGRIKLGFWDAGANAQLSLGGDIKWQFWSVADGARYPIDMGIGGFIEYQEMSRFSILHLGSHLVGSYPFKLSQGSTISPYGRANLRLVSTSADNKTDIKFGLNGGAAWDASATMRFYGEFQLDGNNGVFFGIEFVVM